MRFPYKKRSLLLILAFLVFIFMTGSLFLKEGISSGANSDPLTEGYIFYISKQYPEAIHFFEEKKQQYPEAGYYLAMIYLDPDSGYENPIKAGEILQEAADDSDNEYLKFANTYLQRALNDPKLKKANNYNFYTFIDKETALNIVSRLDKKALSGDNQSTLALHDIYTDGKMLPKDRVKALRYIKPLLKIKNPEALYKNATLHRENGLLLKEAADAGNAQAAFEVYEYLAKKKNIPAEASAVFPGDYLGIGSNVASAWLQSESERYLKQSADQFNKDALKDAVTLDAFRYRLRHITPEDRDFYFKKLNENYPDDIDVMLFLVNSADDVYPADAAHNIERLLLERIQKINPNHPSLERLAFLYIRYFNTAENKEKVVRIYKMLMQNANISYDKKNRISLYFIDSILNNQEFNEETRKFIKEIQNEKFAVQYNYLLADELLKEDADKNSKLAFSYYQQSSANRGSFSPTKEIDTRSKNAAKVHLAQAYITYQHDIRDGLEIIEELLTPPKLKYNKFLFLDDARDIAGYTSLITEYDIYLHDYYHALKLLIQYGADNPDFPDALAILATQAPLNNKKIDDMIQEILLKRDASLFVFHNYIMIEYTKKEWGINFHYSGPYSSEFTASALPYYQNLIDMAVKGNLAAVIAVFNSYNLSSKFKELALSHKKVLLEKIKSCEDQDNAACQKFFSDSSFIETFIEDGDKK